MLSDLQALAAAIARLPDMPQNDALDEVQSIAFDAMEAGTAKRRVELARKALAISPLRADALVVLAGEEKHPAAALTLLREAVAAGEKALGPKTFAEDAGHFWGLIETRPSMRARHMLALALREAGEDEEAVAHFRDMLRLNPNDNQGIRDLLMDALLELGEDAEAEALLKRYAKDRSAAWAWSRTLLAFRRHGDGAKARKALAAALRTNPHVPPYLLGRKPMPRRLPDYCTPGEETEAVSYLAGGAKAWRAATSRMASPIVSGSPTKARHGEMPRNRARFWNWSGMTLLPPPHAASGVAAPARDRGAARGRGRHRRRDGRTAGGRPSRAPGWPRSGCRISSRASPGSRRSRAPRRRGSGPCRARRR